MFLSDLHHKIGVVAAVSGIIQGLTWTVLALIAIILHYSPPDLSVTNNPTFGQALSIEIFSFYIHNENGTESKNGIDSNVIRPQDFIVFMFFYLFLSTIWFVISVTQLLELVHYKKRQRIVMAANGILTLAISILDLILWGLLLRNYLDCNNFTGLYVQTLCFVPTGVVMTLSIRGYTLWVINLCFSYLMIWICLKHKFSKEHWTKRNVDNIPRIKLQDDNSTKRGRESPIYYPSKASTTAAHDDGRFRSGDSPIFADDYPSFFDRNERPAHAAQMPPHPHHHHEPAPARRLPSFLNRGYENDQPPHQPAATRGGMKSFGDRGQRFDY